MEYPPNTQLWASPDCETAIDEAKAYIKLEGYSAETVRLVKSYGMVFVVRR